MLPLLGRVSAKQASILTEGFGVDDTETVRSDATHTVIGQLLLKCLFQCGSLSSGLFKAGRDNYHAFNAFFMALINGTENEFGIYNDQCHGNGIRNIEDCFVAWQTMNNPALGIDRVDIPGKTIFQ